ncbi:hypothetical protein [Mycobacterium sp. NAZ190054]|uniref:hypothetical protein n=1 Tax=Mycobacterium sp. NAZ190054 TaxID=1747766 RepID=UPI000793CEE6|nr:hypothetical protein [Mycobacterium sp. NAZ190054]KWX60313.1 hypothetical protein ASJ79_01385 [Mycobacterium sp. NAZ190054]
MLSTTAAIAVIVGLSAWHLYNRRHPGWQASADGRFFIRCGYPLVAVATYWLTTAPTATTWEWAMGNAWALAAVMSFVAGFNALNRATAEHAQLAVQIETIEPATGRLRY